MAHMGAGLQKNPYARNIGYADGDVQSQIVQSLPQLNVAESTATFTITSADAATQPVVFGAPNIYGFGAVPNFGNDTDITISTTSYASYAQFLNGLSGAPVTIKSIRFISNNTPALQFAQLGLQHNERTTSTTFSQNFNPAVFINPSNNNDTILDISTFIQALDGNKYLSFNILAGNTLTMVLTFNSKVDTTQAMQGAPAVSMGNGLVPAQGNVVLLAN